LFAALSFFVDYDVFPVLKPSTNTQIVEVTENTLLVNWTEPDGNYDHTTAYCVGREGATSNIERIDRPSTAALCQMLTPGAIYDIILETSLTDVSLAPSVNSSHFEASALGAWFVYVLFTILQRSHTKN